MLFDTHMHLNEESYTKSEREALISTIEASFVSKVCDVGYDVPSSKLAVEQSVRLPWLYAAVGVHPHDTDHMTEEDYEEIKRLALFGGDRKSKVYGKVVAIGEIGLDYHYDKDWADKQIYWFKRQIALAKELNMPIIIHSRDADQLCFDILKEEQAYKVPVVIHCYSGSAELAKEYIKQGAYLGIDGPITFKNNRKTIEVAKTVPLDRILIETDSPYMAPVPHRGEKNMSPYVEFVARKIAEVKELSYEEVAEKTYENAVKFFRINGE